MTGDDLIRAIDQHWIQKPEALDAAGDLGDLPARMSAGIALVRYEILDRRVGDRGMAEFHVSVQDNRPLLGFQLCTWATRTLILYCSGDLALSQALLPRIRTL